MKDPATNGGACRHGATERDSKEIVLHVRARDPQKVLLSGQESRTRTRPPTTCGTVPRF